MQQIPKNSSLNDIVFTTNDPNIGDADEVKLVYRKPVSKTRGFWIPAANGSVLTYDFQPGDLDELGIWHVQAYKKIGAEETWTREIKQFEVVAHI